MEPQLASHAREMFSVLSDPAIYEFENEPPIHLDWLEKRFQRLESRASPDGGELWLNWVIRVESGILVGYVQATVNADQTAYVAYGFNSQYWRQGIGSGAVRALMRELRQNYGVTTILAVLKTRNYRSMGLLKKLGFAPATEELAVKHSDDTDESVMVHEASTNAA